MQEENHEKEFSWQDFDKLPQKEKESLLLNDPEKINKLIQTDLINMPEDFIQNMINLAYSKLYDEKSTPLYCYGQISSCQTELLKRYSIKSYDSANKATWFSIISIILSVLAVAFAIYSCNSSNMLQEQQNMWQKEQIPLLREIKKELVKIDAHFENKAEKQEQLKLYFIR